MEGGAKGGVEFVCADAERTTLDLSLVECKDLKDTAGFDAGLEKLQVLTSLKLEFRGCSSLCDVRACIRGRAAGMLRLP